MDSGLHSRMASDVDMGVSGGDAVCVARRAVLCEAVKAFNGSVPVYHHDICNGVFTATVFVRFPLSGGADAISMMDARGGGRRTKDEAEESCRCSAICPGGESES
ncbi:hypothetical protein PVAP13_4NG159000 [Panicum virgatum]|uniref:Uncharacterized protein n=1 Tax=Panicum virgatum TaxID=38727 RepID=A0A8T0TDD6_PANVG|nr:hypothetical protein PVAP13_4NG159000 [Panicum virgatum]